MCVDVSPFAFTGIQVVSTCIKTVLLFEGLFVALENIWSQILILNLFDSLKNILNCSDFTSSPCYCGSINNKVWR